MSKPLTCPMCGARATRADLVGERVTWEAPKLFNAVIGEDGEVVRRAREEDYSNPRLNIQALRYRKTQNQRVCQACRHELAGRVPTFTDPRSQAYWNRRLRFVEPEEEE